MNVVVIAPHPDDEAIGCGGTLRLHADQGDRVVTVFLTSGELGLQHLEPDNAWRVREAEARAAAERLGMAGIHFLRLPDWFVGERTDEAAARVRETLLRERPDLIYLPHADEWHPDHQAALPICRRALAAWEGRTPRLMTYEVWTPLGDYGQVRDITPVIRQKMAAIRCYRSQLTAFRYDRAIRGLNQYRGVMTARAAYAEVFGFVVEPVAPISHEPDIESIEAAVRRSR